MPITLNVNGADHELDATPDTPLLWAIRDHLKMTGTKFGCGMAMCGACTVHMDGQPIRSCSMPLQAAAGKKITTIEGVSSSAGSPVAKIVQQAWNELQVVQCGYCQSGQIMSAIALLEKNSNPSDADIDSAMSGNICRCNTYHRIRGAIKDASEKLS